MSLRPSSVVKREAIIDAAIAAFLERGYDSVTMDAIAEASSVSKQTVYAHFRNKEALFVGLVETMTRSAGDRVHLEHPRATSHAELRAVLRDTLRRQLDIVLTPPLLRLRRLVIGEHTRFPSLGKALAEEGPQRAIRNLGSMLADAHTDGLLHVPNPTVAATQLNWLVMGGPINDAMLIGDDTIPTPRQRTSHLDRCLDLFLAGYAPRDDPASRPDPQPTPSATRRRRPEGAPR